MADHIGETNAFGNATGLPFSSFAEETGLLDLAYSADDLTRLNDMFWTDGIRQDTANWANGDGAVLWTNGFNVSVRPFRGHVNGTVIYAPQAELTVEQTSGAVRIDAVIIRRDYAARTVNVLIVKGVPGSGEAPAVTYNAFGVAEYELARITVRPGVQALAQSDITDMRGHLTADFGFQASAAHLASFPVINRVGGMTLTSMLGRLDLLPFRPDSLPFGWYFCNGDRHSELSVQGAALKMLPQTYKTDWGVVLSDGCINVPNLFYTDGRGYFLRAVDGAARQVGNRQNHAVEDFIIALGNMSTRACAQSNPYAGTVLTQPVQSPAGLSPGKSDNGTALFPYRYSDSGTLAQIQVDTAETRPVNIGMTPAIFLGV